MIGTGQNDRTPSSPIALPIPLLAPVINAHRPVSGPEALVAAARTARRASINRVYVVGHQGHLLLMWTRSHHCGAAIDFLIRSATASGRSHWGQWEACSSRCSSGFLNRPLMCCATSESRFGSFRPKMIETGTMVVCSLPEAIALSCRSRARGISVVHARISASALASPPRRFGAHRGYRGRRLPGCH